MSNEGTRKLINFILFSVSSNGTNKSGQLRIKKSEWRFCLFVFFFFLFENNFDRWNTSARASFANNKKPDVIAIPIILQKGTIKKKVPMLDDRHYRWFVRVLLIFYYCPSRYSLRMTITIDLMTSFSFFLYAIGISIIIFSCLSDAGWCNSMRLILMLSNWERMRIYFDIPSSYDAHHSHK